MLAWKGTFAGTGDSPWHQQSVQRSVTLARMVPSQGTRRLPPGTIASTLGAGATQRLQQECGAVSAEQRTPQRRLKKLQSAGPEGLSWAHATGAVPVMYTVWSVW